jgi:uncharacterized protein YndB with AHSA1/START domain
VSERSVTHDKFTIERTYDAPPGRVFSAWSEPAAKARWFGPGDSHELDFRVGGSEHLAVRGPDGSMYSFDSRYQDIVRDQRIVYAYDMHREQTRISVSLATIEFNPAGEGTLLVLTEQGAFLDGQDDPALRVTGTGGLLDRLAAELESEHP